MFKQHQKTMKHTIAIAFITGTLAFSPVSAQITRTWSAGTGSTNFNATANYTPSGTIDANNIVFNTQTDPTLTVTAGVALNSLTIQSGASGFILSGTNLTIHDGGITVEAGTTATFNNRIFSNGGASALNMNVGAGGTMVANDYLVPYAKPFYKKGAGTLYLDLGMGMRSHNFLRSGTALHIEEGTLEIGNSAQFEPGSNFALAVNLGTGATQARLKGGGRMASTAVGSTVTVYTASTANSIIEPAGDGTLEIQHLNAANGATFNFDLGTDLVFGLGTFTGSTAANGLALNLSGGTTGVLYTLFNYGTLSGVDVSDFDILTSGYVVDSWNIGGGLVQVQFTAVPEPNTVVLVLLSLIGLLIWRQRRVAA